MPLSENNQKRWLTKDFVEKFRAALGREMTADERQYFGLDEEGPKEGSPSSSDD